MQHMYPENPQLVLRISNILLTNLWSKKNRNKTEIRNYYTKKKEKTTKIRKYYTDSR